jgi:uncharacterized membrane-anchored protein
VIRASIATTLCTWLLAAFVTALAPADARAQGMSDQEAELRAAVEAANKAALHGPATVKLIDQAALKLPENFLFVPAAEAHRLLRALGNRPGTDLLGVVASSAPGADWLLVVSFIKSGYVKDDDARDWKADELFTGLKEGTEEVNKERRARGIPEMEVLGWVQAPAYDATTHRLVWSIETKSKGAPDGTPRGVNYNTYALGRDGYISMNLVTGMATIEAEKPVAHQLLAALDYNDGKRYGDFNSSTDHIAEFGLAALIGGVAAKKLGLFALIAAFAAKFAKAIALAVFAFGAGAMKFFRRKKADAPPPQV